MEIMGLSKDWDKIRKSWLGGIENGRKNLLIMHVLQKFSLIH
jgi:hypothetical protein